MTSQRDRLQANALLQAGVSYHTPRMVRNDVETRLVVRRLQVLGSYCQPDCIGQPLAQRPSRQLDTLDLNLRVAWAQRVGVLGVVRLELVEGHCFVSRQV